MRLREKAWEGEISPRTVSEKTGIAGWCTLSKGRGWGVDMVVECYVVRAVRVVRFSGVLVVGFREADYCSFSEPC